MLLQLFQSLIYELIIMYFLLLLYEFVYNYSIYFVTTVNMGY